MDQKPKPAVRVTGWLHLSAVGCARMNIPVTSARMASSLMRDFIDGNCLGASDLNEGCGVVWTGEDQGTRVAVISYNGRVWDRLERTLLFDPLARGRFTPAVAGAEQTEGNMED